jgi:colicin import membrane protein
MERGEEEMRLSRAASERHASAFEKLMATLDRHEKAFARHEEGNAETLARQEQAREHQEQAIARQEKAREEAIARQEAAHARQEEAIARQEQAREHQEEAIARQEQARERQEEAIARQEAARARGEEAIARQEEAVSKHEATTTRSDEIFERLSATLDRHEAQADEFKLFIREMNLRAEKVVQGLVHSNEEISARQELRTEAIMAEVREAREETKAHRKALLALIDRLPPAQAA